jgi:tRNA-dihydrouridine synthase
VSFLKKLPGPFFALAPMYDVTDTVFRQIITGCAAPDLFMTEFVNVDGLQSPGRHNIDFRLKFSSREKPIIAQIWGQRPENFYKTARELVDMGFDGVDINMGCPDKAVVKNGCCIALANNRPKAAEIIRVTKRAVAGKVPISVKTRLGFRGIDLSWIEFLLKQNINMLIVHLRTRKEMSKVPAHWEAMGKIMELRDKIAPKTLVVGNGDVMNRRAGEELAKKYKVDGIMIGRSVFRDPFAFAEHSPWENWSREQKIALFCRHVELFIKIWGRDTRPLAPLNKFCKIYINGFDGAKEIRTELMSSRTTNELSQTLRELKKASA